MEEQHNAVNQETLRSVLIKMTTEYIEEKQSSFAGSEFGIYVRSQFPSALESLDFIDERYQVKGSVGRGDWAQVPWIAILHSQITTSTQRGYYLVYVFSDDMQRVYLSFMQGVAETSKQEMEDQKEDIRATINERKYNTSAPIQKNNDLDLGNSKKAKGYKNASALYIPYNSNNLPTEQQLQQDLKAMTDIYETYIQKESGEVAEDSSDGIDEMSEKKVLEHIHSYIKNKGFYYEVDDVKNVYVSLRTKPFVILSGISGTGKTRMVELFAESVGASEDNGQYTLIPVRPDWSDGSDLLGYTDIQGVFQEGPITKAILKANENPNIPYFVVLDEMNLARVEYYFSDFLSVIESRKWQGDTIETSLLLNEGDYTLTIPENLYIIGTVNMDETTHPFSKKVLDRANTIEFNQVHLNWLDFMEEEGLATVPVTLSNSRMRASYLKLKDAYPAHKELIKEVTAELVKVNQLLEPIQAHVGYRVRDEICFYAIYSRFLLSVDDALDFQFHQKILPRLTASHGQSFQVLKDLFFYFTNHDYEGGWTKEQAEGIMDGSRFPRSAEKVYDMLKQGDRDGFTSFWSS
ncbi:McrB family protein [Halobacillus salinus]|uniref:DUF3578 domain-containing protein n=1 Tax=Halobacillus salinus TaxID=192814 RepID=A0A4Z0GZ57_9BACI|nr:DUF3578 domain-containing protein [Halobacillus salinus]TGB03512.1 DUF3578 domain-containing protein [Halobacillus salinus]